MTLEPFKGPQIHYPLGWNTGSDPNNSNWLRHCSQGPMFFSYVLQVLFPRGAASITSKTIFSNPLEIFQTCFFLRIFIVSFGLIGAHTHDEGAQSWPLLTQSLLMMLFRFFCIWPKWFFKLRGNHPVSTLQFLAAICSPLPPLYDKLWVSKSKFHQTLSFDSLSFIKLWFSKSKFHQILSFENLSFIKVWFSYQSLMKVRFWQSNFDETLILKIKVW